MKNFCLVALLVIATFNVSYSRNLDSVLAQVNDHPYGQALGSLVQMHMSTGDDQGQIQEIHTLLTDLKGELEDQETVAANKCTEIQNECDVQGPATEAELNQLRDQNQDNQNELVQLQEEIGTKESDLASKQQELVDIDNELASLETDAEEAEANYVQRSADFGNAISACQAAIGLMDRMVTGESFAQTTVSEVASSFISIKELFQKEVKLDKSTAAFIQPISDVLAELSTENNLNIEKVTEVKSLITLLMDTLNLGLNDHETEYDRREALVEQQVDDLEAQRHTLNMEIDIIVDRLQEASDRQAQLVTLIAANDSLIAAKERELENLSIECGAQQQMCDSAQNKRVSEIRIIDSLLEFFNAHLE